MVSLFFILTLNAVNSAIVHPGAKIAITQSAFQNFLDAYSSILVKEVLSGNIPDQYLNISLMFTTMKFHFKNIKISNFNIPQSSGKVTLTPPDQININFTNVDLLISADFDLQWFGHYKGNTSILLQNAQIYLPIEMKRVLNRPVIDFNRLDIVASKKRFRFHSNNYFLSTIGYSQYVWPINKLEDYITWRAIESISTKLNPTLSRFFNSLNYTFPVNNTNIALNYNFVEVFVSNPGFLDMGVTGGFLIPSNPTDTPPMAYMNTLINWITKADFRLQLTDYFFISYFWALSETGVLNTTINAGTQPEMAAFLTTSALQLVIPGLEDTFGPNWPVTFVCGVGQYPIVNIVPGNINLNFSIYCTANVIQSIITNQAFSFAWDIGSKLNGNLNQIGKKLFLHYNLNVPSTQFSNFRVMSSNIGNVDLSEVERAVQFSIASIISFINPLFGQSAIEVPLPGYTTITNPTINTIERAAEISATPIFSFD